MKANKTRATDASVRAYLERITDESRRRDCDFLVKLMTKAAKHPARMWGTSIVGFGSYHYKYDSGREGDMCMTGFASRKRDISVYLVASGKDQGELLNKLGKHKMGKACLYIRRLADVDTKVLQQLVVDSVAEIKRRYG